MKGISKSQDGSAMQAVYNTPACIISAAERIGGAQGKYKKWGPAKWIV